MTYAPGFDFDDMLVALNPIIEGYAEGSRERSAAALAQIALLYIRESGKEEDFASFRRRCVDTAFTIHVSHEFETQEEADHWLATDKPTHSERVKITGKGFMAVQASGRWYFVSAPLPEELKAAEWRDVDE